MPTLQVDQKDKKVERSHENKESLLAALPAALRWYSRMDSKAAFGPSLSKPLFEPLLNFARPGP